MSYRPLTEWFSSQYYSALVVAETLGASGKAQIVDLDANGGNEFTPAYAVYENGQPVRIALFNFITDPSGASSYTATISIGSATPSQVKVKYVDHAFSSNCCADLRCTDISRQHPFRRKATIPGLARQVHTAPSRFSANHYS